MRIPLPFGIELPSGCDKFLLTDDIYSLKFKCLCLKSNDMNLIDITEKIKGDSFTKITFLNATYVML